jgi:hypothetical protein
VSDEICPRCGKLILPDEGIYTIDNSHYDCKLRDDERLRTAYSNLQDTARRAKMIIDRLRRQYGG